MEPGLPNILDASQAERLVRTHYAMIYQYARSLLRSVETAEDLVQQVFLIALRKIPTDPPRGLVAPWLRGIARRLMLSSRRPDGMASIEVQTQMLEVADKVVDEGPTTNPWRNA